MSARPLLILLSLALGACADDYVPSAAPDMDMPGDADDMRIIDQPDAGDNPDLATPDHLSHAQLMAALGADCAPIRGEDGRWSWRFEVPQGATSLMMTLTTTRGTVTPQGLYTPERYLDFVNDYRHHNARALELSDPHRLGVGTLGALSFDWSILLPYAQSRAPLLVAGEQILTATTSDDEAPCLIRQIELQPAAQAVALNIYLVGAPGLDAASAPSDPDLQAALDGVRALYAPTGVALGEVRYFDVADEVAQQYAILRSDRALGELTAFGVPRATAELMSVDVFLVQDILIDGGAVLGQSGGVPGPPGLHGYGDNGLVFSTASLGTDNALVAHIIAHELGHYLGLRHTTEMIYGANIPDEAYYEGLIGLTDPHDDTPICDEPLRQGFSCPDARYVMFPAAPDDTTSAAIWSGDQVFALRRSPLTR